MFNFFFAAFLSLLAFFVNARQTSTDNLEDIYSQYQATKTDTSESRIALLIQLNQQLNALIEQPSGLEYQSIEKKFWKKKYRVLGVNVGHYSDNLNYSGKLLVDAKKLDTRAVFSSYTDFADVCASCHMPNLRAALKYEKNFPDGPFIEDVLIVLGNFYDDLFKAIELKRVNGQDKNDYKYECFSKYINNKPISLQLARAQKLGVAYYDKVLALKSDRLKSNQSARKFKKNLQVGDSQGWHYCAD